MAERVLVVASDMSALYVDYVQCNNCETKMLVNLGEDVCPRCKREGVLMDIEQEVQNPFVDCDEMFGQYVFIEFVD
jgi:DNA-directed RNA polymerase subunit RPC12/RpoP